MVRQEIRHSSCLAFLLNPSASHRLGDIFLKTFLKRLLLGASNAPVSSIEIDIANLADTQVRREWKNIDILLFSETSQIVCVIENKVDSQEHSNQLYRYREIVLDQFKDFKQIFVYLTPTGLRPNSDDDQQHWLPYSYDKVAALLDDVSNRYRSTIGSEVHTLIQHYSSLIKRHLMEDSEIAQLCRKIYWQHKEALDLIYEHRPDLEAEVFEMIKERVNGTSSDTVVSDYSQPARKLLRFAVPQWDALSFQKTCGGWTKSNRILLFEFEVRQPNVYLVLTLGPGELSNRVAIFEALNNHDLLGWTDDKPKKDKGWVALIRRSVSGNISPDASISDISEEIQNFWNQFLENELPRINEAIMQTFQPTNPSEP
ncbi:PD-(D/E)XK nuclease family protein [Leptolyngbya sp. FACHB-671]|nr:PD-(D/E)XK nuclease family protein [Leptolyngbya sp. FACHB-671]